MNGSRRLMLTVLLFWILCLAISALAFWTQIRLGVVRVTGSPDPSLLDVIRLQASPWLAAGILTPIAIRWSSRARLSGGGWRRLVSVHGSGLIGYALAFTLLSLYIGLGLRGHAPMWPGWPTLAGRLAGTLALSVTTYAVLAGAAAAHQLHLEAREQAVKADRLARARAELERDLASTRLLVLRQQLQPHFLFNALNAVSGLTDADPAAARRVLARLGDLLRLSLDRRDAAWATLGEELEFVDLYLSVEQARLGDRLRITYALPSSLLGVLLPSFSLQPLVENAVRHGVARLASGGSIEIGAQRSGDKVTLWVRNDAGPAPASRSEGVGLGGLRARLTALHGEKAHLEARRESDGRFVVVVSMPLLEECA